MSNTLETLRAPHPVPLQRLVEQEHDRALEDIGDVLARLQDRTLAARWRPQIPDKDLRVILECCPWANRAPVTWYEHAALLALGLGHYALYYTRSGSGLYLLRTWLTDPKIDAEPRTDGNKWDSGNSGLLHYFASADDDAALHDHPWPFRTRILSGGYSEHLPPLDWSPHFIHGPDWQARVVQRRKGDPPRDLQATDLHCVGAIEADTWTMVETGPKVRDWGFHPPGRPWIQWSDYLDRKSVV